MRSFGEMKEKLKKVFDNLTAKPGLLVDFPRNHILGKNLLISFLFDNQWTELEACKI